MRRFRTYYRFHEVELDDQGDEIAFHERSLPHGTAIVTAAVDDWNESVTPDFVSEPTRRKVGSVRASRERSEAATMAVTVRARDGEEFDHDDVARLMSDFDAMFCDGWGEHFLGPANVMRDWKGRSYYAD